MKRIADVLRGALPDMVRREDCDEDEDEVLNYGFMLAKSVLLCSHSWFALLSTKPFNFPGILYPSSSSRSFGPCSINNKFLIKGIRAHTALNKRFNLVHSSP
jgi:hypothetical protein